MSDEDAAKLGASPRDPSTALSDKRRVRRVLVPLALALLLAVSSAGTAAYYLLEMAGSSTARVAGAGICRVVPAKAPAGAVQGEVVEYAFDVEAVDPDVAFTYKVAVDMGEGSTVAEDEVRYRLWREVDGKEIEVARDSAYSSFGDESLMRFDAAAGTQTHRYVLKAISNATGKLELGVTVTAVQARSS